MPRSPATRLKAEHRFWLNVQPGPGCWEWTGSRNAAGYGVFWLNGRQWKAHRVAWDFARGPIPDGTHACHSCDNRGCVRPDHLFLGTQRDNLRDMRKKGRGASPFTGQVQVGELNRNARVTEEQVREIRRLSSLGMTQKEIAQLFGITRTNVSYIVRRHTWANVA